jgi:XTP/dITP diphosphohydrolase
MNATENGLPPLGNHLKLNTSNKGKLEEFQRLFAKYGITLDAQETDLPEIDADPVTVVVHKASQLQEGVIAEDTSLNIEGANVGINVRWLLENLPNHIGTKAEWRTLLAYKKGGLVYVFEGRVNGTIVQPRGTGGFGFDPFFLPDNAQQTLAESKPDSVNARAKAVEALVNGTPVAIFPPRASWTGPWQERH